MRTIMTYDMVHAKYEIALTFIKVQLAFCLLREIALLSIYRSGLSIKPDFFLT